MAIDNHTVYIAVHNQWKKWDRVIKDTVPYYGFRAYLKNDCGLTYTGTSEATFEYEVCDEQKFMLFVLKYVEFNSIEAVPG